jgi:DNA-binding protein H-NS
MILRQLHDLEGTLGERSISAKWKAQIINDQLKAREMTDLSTLSLEELQNLKDQVEHAIKAAEAKRKEDALRAVQQAAKEHGFSIDDLVPQSKGVRTSKSVGVPKYADPSDQKKVWTGRGRKPQWFVAAIEQGKTPEDMKI